MGRNTLDTLDVIRLTASRRPPRCNQRRQRQEILHAKARPAPTDLEVGVGRLVICPAHGYRHEPSVGLLDGDAVLAPEPLGDDEREGLAAEGMKRVGDPNQWRINGMRCS